VRIAQGVGAIGGLWLMGAPALLGYTDRWASDLHRVIGPLIAAVAIIALWEVTIAVRWPNVVLAAVLVVAPIFGGHPAAAAITGVVTGLAIAVATPFGGCVHHPIGGGWRALTPHHAPEGGST